MPKVDAEELSRWRAIPANTVLALLADYAKPDPTFTPIKYQATTRWHATVAGRDYELLLCGPKFFDTRTKAGGGGAIDLAMHLWRTDFRGAIAVLRQRHI
jgi:hypothetical protein